MSYNEEGLHSCPRCSSMKVEWTNCRDLNILESHIMCGGCDLITFNSDSVIGIRNTSVAMAIYEATVTQYNEWCETKPTYYGIEDWSKYE